ncbi:MAG: cysteine desulfurase family protein [Phycisphaerales bacterium]|nr:cysteine desulfurase family protein [Phycisphaerales bacterium]
MESIYLDNAATTCPLPSVCVKMQQVHGSCWGNASSSHRVGQQARREVELARESVAKLIGAQPAEIIFTSGGTESCNLAINGTLACLPNHRKVITSRLEHSAVRGSLKDMDGKGIEVLWLPNDGSGVVDLDVLKTMLKDNSDEIALVSVMWANNETGAIQPIEEICEICHAYDVRVHTDATQWIGKMPTDLASLPVDLLSFTGHKFHGPKGTGVLYVRAGCDLSPCVTGGPQERGRRAGTENTAGIAGLGVACDEARQWLDEDHWRHRRELLSHFEQSLLEAVDGAWLNSGAVTRLWSTTNIGFPDVTSEMMLLALSERGICCSGGSACSSGSTTRSAVLEALELPDHIPHDRCHASLRFSICRHTSSETLEEAFHIIVEVHQRLSQMVIASETPSVCIESDS